MKKEYVSPYVRAVSVMPETLIALSTPKAYEDEDPDERAPQGSRGFEWEENTNAENYWTE